MALWFDLKVNAECIGTVEIRNVNDLMFVLQAAKPGTEAKIIYIRNGKRETVTATYGAPREDVLDREVGERRVSPPGDAIDDVMLAAVHEAERHRRRVQHQYRPPGPARLRAPADQHKTAR